MIGEGAQAETQAAAWRRKALVAVCILALGSLFFGGCGIEEYVVLEPPSSPSTDSADTTFNHNTDNNPIFEFQGYDVLYCLYDSEDKAKSEASSIELSWTELPPSTIVGRLKSRPFARVIIDGSAEQRIPVFIKDVDFATSIQITLSFSDSGNSKRGAIDFTIRRSVTDSTTNAFLSFGDTRYSATDCSYSNDTLIPNTAYALIYAYAYGFDADYLPIYSQVVRLGTKAIPISSSSN